MARNVLPLARLTRNTGFTPTAQTRSDCAATSFCRSSIAQTRGICPTSWRIGTRLPSVRQTSVSPVTHSRRSLITGFFSTRCSTLRLSWDSAITGQASSLASALSEREISEISVARFSLLPATCISCR